MKTIISSLAFAAYLLPISSLWASSLTVAGDANIFGAGHASAPGPGGGGAGQLPPVFSFAAGPAQILTFSQVTGSVRIDFDDTPGFSNGPDGGTLYTRTDISSFGGLSGIIDNAKTMFLVGAFLSGGEPTDPAPARLDFSSSALTEGFLALAPQLNQVFFIGDGLTGTGSGSVQQFSVPAGATRLFLGFADSYNGGSNTISGSPGFYADNDGSVTATFKIVPEPSSALLLIGGVAGIAFFRRKAA